MLNVRADEVSAVGAPRRGLWREMPAGLPLPRPFDRARLVMPGVLAVDAPPFEGYDHVEREIEVLDRDLSAQDLSGLPLLVLCDDAAFTAETVNNFVWVTFTRSNPSHDVHGVGGFIAHKHWGCRGPLIIDARRKPHHAPPLE